MNLGYFLVVREDKQPRVQFLWSLIGSDLAVNKWAKRIGRTPAAECQHLAKQRVTRLVSTRRHGTQVFYRLDNDHIAQLVTDAVYHAEHAGAAVPQPEHIPDGLALAAHAETYRVEYNTVRPHEALAWNRPLEVHRPRPQLGTPRPATSRR